MLPRINAAIGHIPLSKIRPQHLNDLYENLAEAGIREDADRAVLVMDLEKELRKRRLSKWSFAKIAEVSTNTLRSAEEGNPILISSAQAIAEGLEMADSKVFRIEQNRKPLSKKTILKHHRLISSILHEAEKEMCVMYNAAERATPPQGWQKQARLLSA